ncbi:MAG: ABC transporter permease [Oscillospiraceae bacterium]|nr:ABC transporter permease [Oscillospiraceae bacterium]
MFFRMLKKDLQDGRGLNFIILAFMLIVAVLSSSSGLLIFGLARGIPVSQERTDAPQVTITYHQSLSDPGSDRERIDGLIKLHWPKARISHQEVLPLDPSCFDYSGKDYEVFADDSHSYSISALPTEMALVYDENDKPFHVENGCISVPRRLVKERGLKVGDELTITTQMGRVYKFTVTSAHKDPCRDWRQRFIVSDGDYELLREEFPIRNGECNVQSGAPIDGQSLVLELGQYLLDDPKLNGIFHSIQPDATNWSNTALVSLIVSVFVTAAAVFMLLMIALTLSFSIRSAVKKEERELGIMKALGIESLSFKWLFSAKYIAFAVIGGIVGLPVGVIAGDYLMDNFYYNISYPLSAPDYIPSAVAVIAVVVLIILFILIAMRRIDRISVIDVIHGETRSERMRRTGLKLYRLKKMSTPLFLALSDILSTFKRYVLLFAAFTIGILIVAISTELRDSVISNAFLTRYYTLSTMDFELSFDTKLRDEMSLGTGDPRVIKSRLNSIFEQNDIPARCDICMSCYGQIISDKGYQMVGMRFGFDPALLRAVEGAQIPRYRNEVMIDKFTADKFGYGIGDTFTLEYYRYSEDRLTQSKVREQFVITGFVDRLTSFNESEVIMSEEFDDAVITNWDTLGYRLECPASQKQMYLAKIRELFPDHYRKGGTVVGSFLGMFDVILTFLRNAFMIVVSGVLLFLTVMYQVIFMKDEEDQIASLKSCGFEDRAVAGWQFLRMMILFIAAAVLAAVLMPTLATWGMDALFSTMVGITGWKFTGGFAKTMIWMAAITAGIGVTEAVVLRRIRDIEIWRIRNE